MAPLLCTATLLGSSAQGDSFYALPHGWEAVGILCTAMLLGRSGQWAVGFLPYSASLPWGNGQWDPFFTLPHCVGAARQWDTFGPMPHN